MTQGKLWIFDFASQIKLFRIIGSFVEFKTLVFSFWEIFVFSHKIFYTVFCFVTVVIPLLRVYVFVMDVGILVIVKNKVFIIFNTDLVMSISHLRTSGLNIFIFIIFHIIIIFVIIFIVFVIVFIIIVIIIIWLNRLFIFIVIFLVDILRIISKTFTSVGIIIVLVILICTI